MPLMNWEYEKQNMKILHIVQRYHPAVGGSERYIKELSERFVKAGHTVTVLTTDVFTIEGFWLRNKKKIETKKENLNGVNVERFPVRVFPQQGRLWKILCLLPGDGHTLKYHFPSPIVPKLWKRLKELDGEFDIVHASALPYNSILYAAERYANRNKIPLIFTPFIHLGEVNNAEVAKWYTRPDQIELLYKAEKLIVQTPTELQFFRAKKFTSDALFTLGAGINPEEITGSQGEVSKDFLDALPKGPFVFQIGPQTIDKGTHFLIESLKKLWEKGKQVPLVLVGTTPTEFQKYWEELPSSVSRNISLFGWVSEAEKIEILKRGTILVHPSRTESFGIVFLEAWMWEKPVIGARAGGVVDLIDEGVDGFLVDFDRTEELADKIEKLWQNPNLRQRLGKSGKEKVLHKYTWSKLFQKLLPLYEELVEDNKK